MLNTSRTDDDMLGDGGGEFQADASAAGLGEIIGRVRPEKIIKDAKISVE
jgi:hypothetical protein